MTQPKEQTMRECPFCGGEADTCHDDSSDYQSQWTYGVGCRRWLNKDKPCTANMSGYKTEAEAIAAWNTRHDSLDRVLDLSSLELALEYLETIEDKGPTGYGWQSDKLESLICRFREVIERLKNEK